jgi:hypothetical protein
MRFTRADGGAMRAPLGAIFGGVLALAALGAVAWLEAELPLPTCPLRALTGLACPTCGATRMVEALLHGDPIGALRWNPLVFGAAAAVAAWAALSAAWRLLGLRVWRVVLEGREGALLRLLAVAAVLAGWAYLVWRGV